MPVDFTDCRVLTKHMAAVHENIVDFMWRINKDDFMLRVELYGLKKTIDEILERTKKEKNEPHHDRAIGDPPVDNAGARQIEKLMLIDYERTFAAMATHWRVVLRGTQIMWLTPHRMNDWLIESRLQVPTYAHEGD